MRNLHAQEGVLWIAQPALIPVSVQKKHGFTWAPSDFVSIIDNISAIIVTVVIAIIIIIIISVIIIVIIIISTRSSSSSSSNSGSSSSSSNIISRFIKHRLGQY